MTSGRATRSITSSARSRGRPQRRSSLKVRPWRSRVEVSVSWVWFMVVADSTVKKSISISRDGRKGQGQFCRILGRDRWERSLRGRERGSAWIVVASAP